MRYSNIMVTVIERPSAQAHGGYHYIVTSGASPYTAFKTKAGFDKWLVIANLKLTILDRRFHDEYGVMSFYKADGIIEESLFWNKDELPHDIRHFKGLSNGHIVDCYYKHDNGITHIFKPNPNARHEYVPLPTSKHIKFMKKYG